MNWLTKWFIHHPVGANLLMFAILVSGLLAYGQLRVESFPQIAPSSIAISVSYPGGSAQQIDDSVTQRIEEAISGIASIKQVTSQSVAGMANIIVRKTSSADLNQLLDDVRNVHGDGALSYDAYGYYGPIWQRLIDNGYAVFSWDKPGVGDSTGNWLNQSMQDRQQEVHDAIAFVKNHFRHQAKSVGLMGFSQAGWVVPAVAKNNDEVDFFIGVGFAINWMSKAGT